MRHIRSLRPLALLVPLLLAGCGGAEGQLRKGLIEAGLSESMATCMAGPMARELSLNQLLKLRSLGKVAGNDWRRTSYDKLMHQIRAFNDPVLVRVTTAVALSCALG